MYAKERVKDLNLTNKCFISRPHVWVHASIRFMVLNDYYKAHSNVVITRPSTTRPKTTRCWIQQCGDFSTQIRRWSRERHPIACLLDRIHNPAMHQSHISQCTSPISHNTTVPYPTMLHCAREYAHMSTFLLQNGALWAICLMPCGICEIGLLASYGVSIVSI